MPSYSESFNNFVTRFVENFAALTKDVDTLYEIDCDKEELWNLYLDSFPTGTNEIYRERREMDCSACHHFMRAAGNIAVLKNNKVYTIWGFTTYDPTYQPVVDALDYHLKQKAVTDIFVTKIKKIGTEQNKELLADNTVFTWKHLFLDLPSKFVISSPKSEGDLKGEVRDIRNVFKRSLNEISMDAVNTVLELIADGSLYRGDEWKNQLKIFRDLMKEYEKLSDSEKEVYTWVKSKAVGPVIGKIRNHSIGTLLINISEGMDLDTAVKKYEQIVAPANYKRPKPIFTAKMLENAKQEIANLGFMDSLKRRYATLDDITINNILFSNKDAQARIKGGGDVFDDMLADVKTNPKKFDRVEEVPIDRFVEEILPIAKSVEAYVENKHTSNFVSLIAPENADAPTMFKWDNAFGWAYTGNITDSDITERVRNAGGRTDGVLRFSHSWNYPGMRNASLMDLHVFLPGSNQKSVYKDGREIHDNYGNGERVGWNNRRHYSTHGVQDVDYVTPAPETYIPVENTTFPRMELLPDGVYIFKIHNWNYRNPTTGGFKAELAFGGEIYRFEHREALKHKEWVTLAKLEKRNGEFRILEMKENDTMPTTKWNIRTGEFVPVTTVMYSPNYWDEQQGSGNKHYFFMLKDCINDEEPNGFYNEFLRNELNPHRHVLEALGTKLAVASADDQLSGIGFSSTKRNDLIVKVTGATERVLKIKF